MKIAFLGNMNNWSYAVAKRMTARGYDVTLFVDAPPDYPLDRPEAADADLQNGYPPWIVELKGARSSTSIPYLYIRLAFRSLIQRLEAFDVVFLNGMFISLAPYVRPQAIVVAMFSGFDLDLCAPRFVSEFAHARFHKYKGRVPVRLLEAYYSRVWRNQARGIRRADIVDYFAPGMNPESDNVLATIKRGQSYRRTPMRRALACEEWAYRPPKLDRDTFHVLSAMRFDFLTMGRNDNKRNDLMLEGIGLFVRDNAIQQGLVIDFFEKGQDVDAAKAICRELGIERFVRWNKVVALRELVPFFEKADVVIDQLGVQLIGGSGLYSMLVGRPLIANGRPEVFDTFFKEKSPVCQSTTALDVARWLTALYRDRNLVQSVGLASAEYMRRHYGLDKDIDAYLAAIEEVQLERAATSGQPPFYRSGRS